MNQNKKKENNLSFFRRMQNDVTKRTVMKRFMHQMREEKEVFDKD